MRHLKGGDCAGRVVRGLLATSGGQFERLTRGSAPKVKDIVTFSLSCLLVKAVPVSASKIQLGLYKELNGRPLHASEFWPQGSHLLSISIL